MIMLASAVIIFRVVIIKADIKSSLSDVEFSDVIVPVRKDKHNFF